jgi:multimeric flavodoxin WrbA
MDRRDFLKKTAMAAAATVVAASPLAAGENFMNNLTDKKMKVLLINGSPRVNGNTSLALGEIAKQLDKHGVETELVQIGNKPLHCCVACGYCRSNKHCVFTDDLCNEVVDKLATADALIVGTPTYYGQPNGGVLSLMQRVFYANGAAAQNKPAAGVAVCRRGGATAALSSLNMMFQLLNMPLVTSQYWNIVYGRDKGEAALDTEGMQTMRTLADNMSWMLRKIHAGGNPDYPQRESEWQGMNFIR